MTSVPEGDSPSITSVINRISQNNENVKHSVDTNAESEDAANRRNMTAEERRNTFPESMKPNENVVFADEGVSYVSFSDENTKSYNKLITLLRNDKSVVDATYIFDVKKDTIPREEKASNAINNYFQSIGGMCIKL